MIQKMQKAYFMRLSRDLSVRVSKWLNFLLNSSKIFPKFMTGLSVRLEEDPPLFSWEWKGIPIWSTDTPKFF